MEVPLCSISSIEEETKNIADIAENLLDSEQLVATTTTTEEEVATIQSSFQQLRLIMREMHSNENQGGNLRFYANVKSGEPPLVRAVRLVEPDGIAPFVYSDGALATRRAGLLERKSYHLKQLSPDYAKERKLPHLPRDVGRIDRSICICRFNVAINRHRH